MWETNIQISPCWPSQPPLTVSCDIRVVVIVGLWLFSSPVSFMRKFSLTFALKKGFPGNPPLPCGSDTQIGPVFNPTHHRLSWLSLPVWEVWVFLGKLASGLLPDVRQLQHFSYYSSDASTRITFGQFWDSKAKTTHIKNRWMTETSWTGGLEKLHALEQLHGLEEALADWKNTTPSSAFILPPCSLLDLSFPVPHHAAPGSPLLRHNR